MYWEFKEIEVAAIMVEMKEGLNLPGKEDDRVVVAGDKKRVFVGSTGEKRKLKIILPRKPQPTSLAVGTSSNVGFPFVIVSFLSAVRIALMTPTSRDLSTGVSSKGWGALDSSIGWRSRLPSLTFDQILQRVRFSPGDARVLQMRVRLQDLLRGVLRVFLSTTPPPGVSWWAPIVVYNKKTKLWSWVGPVPEFWPLADVVPTTPMAWGMRGTILTWFVDRFGEWLNASVRVLEQIASLPAPPLSMMPWIPAEERYTETRNLKNSVLTIGPSSEAVRAYFQREETLRYSIPEQAFSYTTRDGMKSTVVPLKKGSGKPSKRARDHYILKPERPPFFTVLCLVRDAAARLPHRSGTRSDICILVRDSQFVKENVTDYDIKQVVVGALDRLHYEVDPCISFDKDQRLWFYLHGDKQDEDFDENCTVSTKGTRNQSD